MTKTTAAAAKKAQVTEVELAGWLAEVLDRQDAKGETLDQAIEAVLGSSGLVATALRAYAQGN